jgi:hypothetical protein
MIRPVDTKVPAEVEEQVEALFRSCFPEAGFEFVSRAFGWVQQCFSGNYPGYQAIDTRYHDLEHTLQGTLCLMRLLEGRHHAGADPILPPKWFELGLLAILFHDTGYLKQTGDDVGTGAKYTSIHVGRSAAFARDFLGEQGYSKSDLTAIQNMIRCTGVRSDLKLVTFQSREERLVGFALATSDLLGQMAATDYVEKLPVLFLEFAEAARHDSNPRSFFNAFESVEDLIRNSSEFWKGYVLPKIQGDFEGLYRYLNDPYPDGHNDYIARIERNISRLQRMLQGTS